MEGPGQSIVSPIQTSAAATRTTTMSREDFEYYQRRERQARDLAERALDASSRRAHLAMAEHYGDLTRRAAA